MRYVLPSPVPLHDAVTLAFHALVDGVGVVANALLFAAVYFRSPASIRSYSIILMGSAFFDGLGCLSQMLSGVRFVSVSSSLFYVYVGPCTMVSAFSCHVLYSIMLHTFTMSLYLITLSFAYRLYVLRRSAPPPAAIGAIIAIAYCPALLLIILLVPMLDPEQAVRQLAKQLRPDYDFDEYMVEGHLSVFSFELMFAHVMMIAPFAPCLAAIVILRSRVINTIEAQAKNMSERTLAMHSTLVKVLSLQSMLPIVWGVAILCYVLQVTDIAWSPLQEHMIFGIVDLMPALAPLITIYYVRPFRNFVADLLCCRPPVPAIQLTAVVSEGTIDKSRRKASPVDASMLA